MNDLDNVKGEGIPSAPLPYDRDAVTEKASLQLANQAQTSPSECGCPECEANRAAQRMAAKFAFSAEQSERQASELWDRASRNRRASVLIAKNPQFVDLLELLSIVPVQFIKS